MSHDQLANLLQPENEMNLIKLLQEKGVISKTQQCKFCGDQMHIKPQGKYLNWVCQRRVNGVKCNRGKFSIRYGTFFDNTG